MVEVVERPERGLDGHVAAGLAADRPRAADIVGRGHEGVVAALADACGRSGGSAAGTGRRTPFPRCEAAPIRLRETSRSGSARGRPSAETSRTTTPYRARSRSTSTRSTRSYCVARLRSAAADAASASRGSSAASSRSRRSASLSRIAARSRRKSPRGERVAASRAGPRPRATRSTRPCLPAPSPPGRGAMTRTRPPTPRSCTRRSRVRRR